MRPKLISKISRYYRDKIIKFGSYPKGVDWKDKKSQILRFKQLLKIINKNIKR